jgi:Polyketide cyclase / dehydrase and lipid transport
METTMTETGVWRTDYSAETTAASTTIWSIFRDVPGWKNWNAGIAQIEIDGPFAAGTWFTMQPPGEAPLRSRLIEVRDNTCFVDETRVGDLVVTVAHSIEPLSGGRTRITYAVEARGPDAAEIGAAVSADFPEVLAALVKLAETKSA